jgi:hypothetical protein
MEKKTMYMIGGGTVVAAIAAYFIFRPKAAAATPAKSQLATGPKTATPEKPAFMARTNASGAMSPIARFGQLNKSLLLIKPDAPTSAPTGSGGGGGLIGNAEDALKGIASGGGGGLGSAAKDVFGNLLGQGTSGAAEQAGALNNWGSSGDQGSSDGLSDLEQQFVSSADQGQADMADGSTDSEYKS